MSLVIVESEAMASPNLGANGGSGNNPAAALASIAVTIGAAGAQVGAACASIRKFAICASLCLLVGTAVGLCFIPFLQWHLVFVPAFAGAEIGLLSTACLVCFGKFGPFMKRTGDAYFKQIACHQVQGASGLGFVGVLVGGLDAGLVSWMSLGPG